MKHRLIYREKLWFYIGDGVCGYGWDQAHSYEQWLDLRNKLRRGRLYAVHP